MPTIASDFSNSVTLGSLGVPGPLIVTNTGEITPTGYGLAAVYEPAGAGATAIFNAGLIEGGAGTDFGSSTITTGTSNEGGAGLVLNANYSLENIGVVRGGSGGEGALGQGGNVGGNGGAGGAAALIDYSLYLLNLGTMSGGQGGAGNAGIGAGGGTGGAGGAGVIASSSVNLTNIGIIQGGSAGVGGIGDSFLGAGGQGGDGGTGGIALYLKASTLTNNGEVVGGCGGAGGTGDLSGAGGNGGAGGAGVTITAASLLLNRGTIQGGDGGLGGNGGNGRTAGIAGSGGNGGNGAVVLSSSSLYNEGTIYAGVADAYGMAAAGTSNSGSLSLGPIQTATSGVYLNGATLINAGEIDGRPDGYAVRLGPEASTVIVRPGASFIGEVAGSLEAGNILDFEGRSASTFSGIGSSIYGFSTIEFASDAGWTIEGEPTGFNTGQAIRGFDTLDSIILDNVQDTVQSYNSISGLVLGGSETQTLDIGGDFTAADFTTHVEDDRTTIDLSLCVPCFAQGTHLRTVCGKVPVEKLKIGDKLLTSSGVESPIIWIGRRHLQLQTHPYPERVQPVCILPNTFGEGCPSRMLYLSPDHALFFEGLLIPVKALIDEMNVYQEYRKEVIYFHVELETHSVIFAEELAVETYLDTGNRGGFENESTECSMIFEQGQLLRESQSCGIFTETGPALERIKEIVRERHKEKIRGSLPY